MKFSNQENDDLEKQVEQTRKMRQSMDVKSQINSFIKLKTEVCNLLIL
jgi:hypothetical protein